MQNNRVTITILPENRSVKVPAGTTIADALLNCNIVLHTPCGGKGICKKCTVHTSGLLSQPDDYEKSLGDSSLRLACRAVIIGDTTIWIDSITQRPRYPELNPTNTYAVAIDIGTTTVQIAFFDMTTKQAMPEITLLNPQRRFGQDVMTRISNANDHAKASHLTQILLQTIITTIQDVCNISGIDIHSIVTIAISGNTVMSYSFLGIDITPLGTYPYTTLITSFDNYNHYPPLKKTFPNAQVTVLPAVSAFLGGDFLGGVGTLEDKLYFDPVSGNYKFKGSIEVIGGNININNQFIVDENGNAYMSGDATIYGGKYYAGQPGGSEGFSQMTANGFDVYNGGGDLKLKLGYTTEDEDFPFLQLGSGSGLTKDFGLVKKFADGLWIGNSIPADDQGTFNAQEGYNGIFFKFSDNTAYVVKNTNMKNIYTGAAIAKFG